MRFFWLRRVFPFRSFLSLIAARCSDDIQKYHGKTMVVKYGGNAMINEELKNAVMNDLVTLTLLGAYCWGWLPRMLSMS